MKKIFLAASVPPPGSFVKDGQSLDTDRVAARDAVIGLLSQALKKYQLCFGGHPAISPFVLNVAENLEAKNHVTIFQAGFFASEIPTAHRKFDGFVWDDGRRWTAEERDALGHQKRVLERNESLERMRKKMLAGEHHYAAGFFIGGKQGVIDEYVRFCEEHPQALAFPVGSTGGASQVLYEQFGWRERSYAAANGRNISHPEELLDRMGSDLRYRSVFRDILKLLG
jgi:hypothetical protein